MEPNRKLWNLQQKKLQSALAHPSDHRAVIERCLCQHAALHSALMARTGLWSFQDELVRDLDELAFRVIPPRSKHSIAWHLWHIT